MAVELALVMLPMSRSYISPFERASGERIRRSGKCVPRDYVQKTFVSWSRMASNEE